ncbi:hypothetical protein MRB53_000692 [Persea americana]|uniref:Uncharacterized protein n=1 Tax=Persea americana TaxID=3435 RepID=A0ACC2MQK5_PERAE|nr:hypothetical protein MRB53_000692 [Persea americana]
MNINPYAWPENGSERTQYPSQVLIRIRTQCQPLQEMQFRTIIYDNFYTSSHFWFELDHAQVDSLVVLFTATCNSGARINPPYNLPNRRQSIGNANSTSVPSTRMNLFVGSKEGPKRSAKQGLANRFEAINTPNNLPNRRPSIGNANSTSVPNMRMNLFVGSKVGPKPPAKQGLANRFEALGWEDPANNDCGSCSVSSSIGYDGNLNLSEFPDLNPTSKNIGCSSTSPRFDGESIALEAHEEIWENDEEIDENVFAITAVVNMYAKCRQIENARGCLIECLREIWSLGMQLFLDVESLRIGRAIHGYTIRAGFELPVNVSTALVDINAKCGLIGIARLVFDRMRVKNVVSWNSMIDGYP